MDTQGGCGMKGPAVVRLSGSPAGFVLALAWASSAAPVVDVVAVCSAIPTRLDLKQAYPGACPPHHWPANHRRCDGCGEPLCRASCAATRDTGSLGARVALYDMSGMTKHADMCCVSGCRVILGFWISCSNFRVKVHGSRGLAGWRVRVLPVFDWT